MPNNKPRTPEQLQQAVDAAAMYGSQAAAAEACGLATTTFKDTLKQAEREGYTPGTHIKGEQEDSTDPADPIELRRLRDRVSELTTRVNDAERRAGEAEDYRGALMGLTEIPAKARPVPSPKRGHKPGGRTVFVALSDLHFGEVVDPDEMDGLNSFNTEICKARLSRYFHIIADLSTNHWHGKPPDEIVVWIGGDLISGALHPELVATDDLTIPEGVKVAGEHIAGGLLYLSKTVGVPIRVYESVGNHGRATIKPQTKMVIRNSFDALALDFCEMALKHTGADVTFYRCKSIDTVVPIYGFNVLCTHGDRMGAGGGRGFIGAAAPISRGHQKLMMDAAKIGRPVDWVVTGHFHSTMRTPWGWGNGAFPGYNEFARQFRFEPEGAKQTMLVVEQHKGVISSSDLFLGVPEEGTLYGANATT